ncbi:LOW QUALITY PROTEIN: olfactory receptor 8S1-like [Diceros bicornis minor]|uniref:LOW QUALITY PROTEIN: olfactory receptor 8S1-like n=1 Tax=Diceros bicornis minor TaxID=77932 RepID=UPI0026EABA88|nr:LOW QUALITY PROTEIN: olfactory receptor 8S1-like [Diceros bicornis minor]
MDLGNHSTITEFTLLGLSANPHIQALFFVLFLDIYLLTIVGNLMMLLVIKADAHLHTPMYFFLSHLSFLDLCLSSVTMPKMLKDLLSVIKTISVRGCLAQGFFVFISAGTEGFLLSVMAYDCYAAVCHPLLYGQMMRKQLCLQLVWGSWGLGFLNAFINILLAANLSFCENHIISHYSCEVPSLFPLSCSDVSTNFIVLLCSSLLHGLGTFFPITSSYAYIVSTLLSISSTTGRSKAFSTCSSHIIVVSFFFGSAFLRYLMPTSGSPLELIFSVQYSMVTPMLNPLIYSLKNKKVKAAVRRTLGKYLPCYW